MSVNGFRPEALRAARHARGWTQEQLAVAIGAHRGAIHGYESGGIAPMPRRLRELAESLSLHTHDLVLVDHDAATLVDYRSWAGLSQADAAAAIGLSAGQLGAIERGAIAIPERAVTLLAEVCGVPTTRLLEASERAQAAYRKNLE